MSKMNFEHRFGDSSIFVTSTLMEEGGAPPSSSKEALLKEAIHVMSCDYEDRTEWGTEVTQQLEFHCFFSWSFISVYLHEHSGHLCICSWDGFMVQLQKISSQDSSYIQEAGGPFTVCQRGLHSRVRLQSICQIGSIRPFVGHLVLLRFSSAGIIQSGMASRKESSSFFSVSHILTQQCIPSPL